MGNVLTASTGAPKRGVNVVVGPGGRSVDSVRRRGAFLGPAGC